MIDGVAYEPEWAAWAAPVAVLVASGAGTLGIRSARWSARTRRVLRTRVWTPLRVRVLLEGEALCFTTADGLVWRSVRDDDWPEPNWESPERSGWGLPDEDPGDVPYDQAAWWVCDGTDAVFSPDQGSTLILARRC